METRTVTREAETELPAKDEEVPQNGDQEETARTEPGLEAEAPGPEAELEALRQELEAAKAKSAEHLDGWQRARAELANYKKRVERERAEAYQNAAGAVLTRLLPALDDFERAMKDAPDEPAVRQWVEGLSLIQRKLLALVENQGVTRIEAEGAQFDPNWHEAITHDESENHSEGQVIEVVRQGYRMGDRVLRPALVRVAK